MKNNKKVFTRFMALGVACAILLAGACFIAPTRQAQAGNVLQDAATIIRHTAGYNNNERIMNLENCCTLLVQTATVMQQRLDTLEKENAALKYKLQRMEAIVATLTPAQQ